MAPRRRFSRRFSRRIVLEKTASIDRGGAVPRSSAWPTESTHGELVGDGLELGMIAERVRNRHRVGGGGGRGAGAAANAAGAGGTGVVLRRRARKISRSWLYRGVQRSRPLAITVAWRGMSTI